MIQVAYVRRIILTFENRESLDHCRQNLLTDFFNTIHPPVAVPVPSIGDTDLKADRQVSGQKAARRLPPQ